MLQLLRLLQKSFGFCGATPIRGFVLFFCRYMRQKIHPLFRIFDALRGITPFATGDKGYLPLTSVDCLTGKAPKRTEPWVLRQSLVFFRSHNTLRIHGIHDLLKPGDIRTYHIISLKAIFLCRLIDVVIQTDHDLLQLFINLFK